MVWLKGLLSWYADVICWSVEMKDDTQHRLNDLVGEILPPESSLIPSDKDLAIRFAIAELKYEAEERRRGQLSS
jgi:hypothetical protein